ncbi:AbrB/MazE/SpoVT family DNA-binding domain-containing protein [Prosthecobacter fusiformis]|nr:AbrB/MazE/SpoVT family DNA-binding domain-containing protein [Prosthecobacter fusiformis]
MTAVLTLDSSGRLVLPKPFRDKMHLQAGAKLRLDMVGDKLELSQEEEDVKVVRRGKRRVIVGWEGFDAAKAVREMRKDQVERLEAPFRK